MKQSSTSFEETPTELVNGSVLCDEELRDVYITGVVDGNTYQNVMAAIRHLDQTKGVINLIINSPGGDAPCGLGIADCIKGSRNKIMGYAYGECMSIGMTILQACDERISAPSTRFLIHDIQFPLPEGQQDYSFMKKWISEAETVRKALFESLVERSDLTLEEIKVLCKEETYMSADVAMGYGFLDGILDLTHYNKNNKKAKCKARTRKTKC